MVLQMVSQVVLIQIEGATERKKQKIMLASVTKMIETPTTRLGQKKRVGGIYC